MRKTALVLTVFILMTLPVSLVITSTPVDISVEDGEEIVNIDVCNAGKELPGDWVPMIPSSRPAFVELGQKPYNPRVPVQFESISPVTVDPPPKTLIARGSASNR